MSDISEKVYAAIYSKSNVGAVVGANKLTAVFADKAKTDALFPYGVFNRQASEPVIYAFNVTRILESDLYQFRVYGEKATECETLLNTWISTLGTTLTITGNTVSWCARVNDLPANDQQINARYIYGRGCLVRIAAE